MRSGGLELQNFQQTQNFKGRNVYKNGCKRLLWRNEDDRLIALNEKHDRGDKARLLRYERLTNKYNEQICSYN